MTQRTAKLKDELAKEDPKTYPLTTALKISGTPTEPPSGAKTPSQTPQQRGTFTNDLAGFGGGVPPSPPIIPITEDFQLAAGVYIAPGSTGSGKSLAMTGLAAWANWATIAATYYYMFEARARPISAGSKRIFDRPKDFLTDITKAVPENNELKIVICDSVTLAMKASTLGFTDQATFTGGAQPSDYGFLSKLGLFAVTNKCCLILTLNSDQINYASILAGATEGIITVKNISTFSVRDRTSTSRRQAITINIPNNFVQMALNAWNYGTFRATANSASGRIVFKGI